LFFEMAREGIYALLLVGDFDGGVDGSPTPTPVLQKLAFIRSAAFD